jgi:3-hydroxyacyl-[acyl-carrier-protein] dehydratase
VRFELVDRVVEREADRVVVVKNVTLAEEYLADHFPGFPVLPGVMMLEALVQAARLLLQGRSPMPMILAEARNVKYGQMVRPGQSLIVEVTLRGQSPSGFEFIGAGRVDQQVAVHGRFRLAPLPAR